MDTHRDVLIETLEGMLKRFAEDQQNLDPGAIESQRARDPSVPLYVSQWSQLECLCDDLRAMIKHLRRHF